MQASKIKVGEHYAFRRGMNDLVRFQVEAINTRKDGFRTLTELEGYFVEDRADGQSRSIRKLTPSELIGPYQEQAELVERKRREDAERKRKHDEQVAKGNEDRMALYKFVRIRPASKDPTKHNQMFRVGYGGNVEMSSDGIKAVVKRVHALAEAKVTGVDHADFAPAKDGVDEQAT